MEGKRFTWYKTVQLLILLFAMSLMLSKKYTFFKNIFSVFYESGFSIISVIVGSFSILHGLYMLFKSFGKANKVEDIK